MGYPGFGRDADPPGFAGSPGLNQRKPGGRELIIRQENNLAIARCGDRQTTLAEWSRLIDELDRLDCPAVIDARRVNGYLTEIDAYLLALHAGETRQFRRHRMAVVISGDPERHLGFFVVSARSHGLKVESFDSVDDATAWAAGNNQRDN